MEALAVHVMVDLHGCPFELLDDQEKLRGSLRRAAEIAKTEILRDSFVKFQPQGVSGVLVVSESHLSVHTWPEHGYAAVDVFSCGDAQAVEEAVRFLVKAFQATRHTTSRTDRGILNREPSMHLRELETAAMAATA